MQGILQNTLAALGYILFTLTPTDAPVLQHPIVVEPLRQYVHVVKEGETLTSLAGKYYDSHDYWTTVWNDNEHVINPSEIKIGAKLYMRSEKPLLVEYVKEERLAKILSSPDNKKLDPALALTQAQSSQGDNTTIAKIVPTTIPKVQAEIIKAPEIQQTSDYKPSNFDAVYQQAGSQYGVPWQVLYGLHLTETGLRDGAIYNGQGSGAQGPMQFMPGTWRAYGVDGNGDGVSDINNAVDAIHGAANFLVKHGSLHQGLRSYGGNTAGVLAAACQRGYCQ